MGDVTRASVGLGTFLILLEYETFGFLKMSIFLTFFVI